MIYLLFALLAFLLEESEQDYLYLLVLFQTEDGQTKLEVQLQDETVWLTIDQMAELFQRQ